MEFCAELMNTTPDVNAIPGFASQSEFGMYAIASVEESYNAIMQEIGIAELAAVMEANGQPKADLSIKSLIKKFADWVKEVWQKFTGLVTKCRNYIITYLGEKILKISKVMKKVKLAELTKAIDDSSDDKWKGFKAVVSFNDRAKTGASALANATDEIVNKCIDAVKKAETIEDISKFETDLYAPITNILKISVDQCKDAAALKEAVKKKIRVETKFENAAEAKKYASKNIGEIYSFYQNKSNTIKNFDEGVKKPFNELKKGLDKAIKESKKAENGKELKPLFSAVRVASKVSNTVVNAVMDIVVETTTHELRILAKSIALVGIKNIMSESAVDYAPSTFQTELSSLFKF